MQKVLTRTVFISRVVERRKLMRNFGENIEKLKAVIMSGFVLLGGLYASATSEKQVLNDFQPKSKIEINKQIYGMVIEPTAKYTSHVRANKGRENIGK